MSDRTHAYIVRCKTCGDITGAHVDYQDRDTAAYVARWIREAKEPQRCPLDEARHGQWCKCPRHPMKAAAAPSAPAPVLDL